MPHRLPSAPESRVLLALYHKGPLNRTQLFNLQAISSVNSTSALHGLVEKTLIEEVGRAYRLSPAARALCDLCLIYNLMVETNFTSDPLSHQVMRRSTPIEGVFEEVPKRNIPVSAPPTPLQLSDTPPVQQPDPGKLAEAPACPSMSFSMAAQTAGTFGTGAPSSPAPVKTPLVTAVKPLSKAALRSVPPPRIYSVARRK